MTLVRHARILPTLVTEMLRLDSMLPVKTFSWESTLSTQSTSGARSSFLVDARPPADYNLHTIVGAISIPYYDMPACADTIPEDAWVVTFCACPLTMNRLPRPNI